MVWTDTDDEELQECYDKLIKRQKELNPQMQAVQVIINNTAQIQTRRVISYNGKREQLVEKIKPKDKWGEDMTDEYRLQIKEECITKTNELLGTKDEK